MCSVVVRGSRNKQTPFLLLPKFPVSDCISRSVNTTTVAVHAWSGEEVQHQSFSSRHETEVGSQLKGPADLTPPPPPQRQCGHSGKKLSSLTINQTADRHIL